MIHEKQGMDTVRAVFIMDPTAKVRLILYYPQEVGRSMAEMLTRGQSIAAYLASEKAAIPANWPENELVGDHIIVPPANTEADAKKRSGQKGLLRLVVLSPRNEKRKIGKLGRALYNTWY